VGDLLRMCKKTVAVKVSEAGQSCMHPDDVEGNVPFHSKPAADQRDMSTPKDAVNWSSCQDEAASTKSRSSDVEQEMIVVDDVVICSESSHRDDVFDMDSADTELAIMTTQELTEPVAVTTQELLDIEPAAVTTQELTEPAAVTTRELLDVYVEHEKTQNFAEAVESTTEKESHVIDTAEIETESTLASTERTASAADNWDGRELVDFTSRLDVNSASESAVMEPVAVAAAMHSVVSAGAGTDNSAYHEEGDVCVVHSISDINSSCADNSIMEASQRLTASDQQIYDDVKMDVTEELDVRWSTGDQSVDKLGPSQAQADSSDSPCVPMTVSESELHLADESSSGLPSRGGCEEDVKVCCVCFTCGTLHVNCTSCPL